MRIEKTAPNPDAVVTFDNIVSIWNYLQKISDPAASNFKSETSNGEPPKQYKATLTITFEQDPATTVTIEGARELERELVAFSKTRSISIKLWCAYSNKDHDFVLIKFTEVNKDGFFDNRLQVSGTSKEWVDASFNAVTEIIRSFKPQHSLTGVWYYGAVLVAAIPIGYFLWPIVFHLMGPSEPAPPPPGLVLYLRDLPGLKSIVLGVLYAVLGYLPGEMLIKWISASWPKIEFDFGPEHLRSHKQKRKKLALAFAILGAPFVFEVMKRYVLGWN